MADSEDFNSVNTEQWREFYKQYPDMLLDLHGIKLYWWQRVILRFMLIKGRWFK